MRVPTWNAKGKHPTEAYRWRLVQYRPEIMVVQEAGNMAAAFGILVAPVDHRPIKESLGWIIRR
jgi:hypothetical protein